MTEETEFPHANSPTVPDEKEELVTVKTWLPLIENVWDEPPTAALTLYVRPGVNDPPPPSLTLALESLA